MHLPCAATSVGIARRALISELRAAGVPDPAVRDAALVISELLSNAVVHAYPLPGKRIQVTWSVDEEEVEVAVSDGGSATKPHVSHPSAAAIGGRGLAIVAHLSQAWGVRSDEVGLTVWAVLADKHPNGHGDRPRGSHAIGRLDLFGRPGLTYVLTLAVRWARRTGRSPSSPRARLKRKF